MVFVYNVFIRLYGALIFFAQPFNSKAKLVSEGRKDWRIRLSNHRKTDERWVWLHACSLGEFEDFVVVLKQIQNLHPGFKFLLTFNSPSGFEVIKDTGVCDAITYLPLDTPNNASDFLEILKPEYIYFSRSELWYNFLNQIGQREIPAFLVGLFMDEKSGFLKPLGRGLVKTGFHAFTHIFCQDEPTKIALQTHFDYRNASVVGNSRIDRIFDASLQPKSFPKIEQFVGDDFCIVVGSSEPSDEELLFQTINDLSHKSIKWIVVPHEIEGSPFIEEVEKSSLPTAGPLAHRIVKFSNLAQKTPAQNILLIDFVGSLKYFYQYADLAIIGGGFRKQGIHNIIEPSAFGVPTLFGPNIRDYVEAKKLLKMGASQIFTNANELTRQVLSHLSTDENVEQRNRIRSFVADSSGASRKILAHLSALQNACNTQFSP
jgi:3-deoxy-D-manno-octulosonic-acid transferase